VWVSRDEKQGDDAELLLAALRNSERLPEGDGYVWIAAEAHVARRLRAYVLETLGHPKRWVKASGYWTRGKPGAHVDVEN
jgi:NADPH-dependent ferric siderophore reductase